jgi:hypothetical protein
VVCATCGPLSKGQGCFELCFLDKWQHALSRCDYEKNAPSKQTRCAVMLQCCDGWVTQLVLHHVQPDALHQLPMHVVLWGVSSRHTRERDGITELVCCISRCFLGRRVGQLINIMAGWSMTYTLRTNSVSDVPPTSSYH